MLGNAVGGIVGKFKELTAESVNLAASREAVQVSMAGFLKSEEKAVKLMEQLNKFGASTPFQVTDLRNWGQTLLSFGFTADSIIPNLRMLGDMTGGSAEKMNRILFNFAQVKSTGKAQMQDLRSFAMAGIPIFDQLEKSLGKTKDEVNEMIRTGKIGLPEIEKAFKDLTGEGGLFHNQMARTSKTFKGMVSNLQDTIENALEGAGQPLMVALKPVVKEIARVLDKMKPAFKTLGVALGQGATSFLNIFKKLGTGDKLNSFMLKFSRFLRNTMFVIEDFFNYLFGEKDTVFEQQFGSMAGFGMSIIKDIAETVASVAYEIFKILFIKILDGIWNVVKDFATFLGSSLAVAILGVLKEVIPGFLGGNKLKKLYEEANTVMDSTAVGSALNNAAESTAKYFMGDQATSSSADTYNINIRGNNPAAIGKEVEKVVRQKPALGGNR